MRAKQAAHSQNKRWTFWLKAFAAALLPLTVAASCVSGSPEGDTGTLQQAALCQPVCPCPPQVDNCGYYKCSVGCCYWVDDLQEGSDCLDQGDNAGICSRVPDGTLHCCAGCIDDFGQCHPPDDPTGCGKPGDVCKDCGSQVCMTTVCKEYQCVSDPQSGTSCPNGKCVDGSCCHGCIDSGTCYQNDQHECGKNGGACTDCGECHTCNSGTCAAVMDATACNDGNDCTNNDTCTGGLCDGDTVSCNDSEECTTDSCDPAGGCMHTNKAGSCNDGDACTTGDTCSGGACAGTPVACNDGNFCTNDSCDPATGCVYSSKSEGTTCDDGNDCSPTSACEDDDSNPDTARVCVGTSGLDCNDSNPCTSDNCQLAVCPEDVDRVPVNEDGPCATTVCKTGQTCSSGTCSGGTAVDCDDDNPCTEDDCDDVDGCTHTALDADCNDGNPCTFDDKCVSKECKGTDIECAPLDECHQAGKCDADTATCSDPRQPDGAKCGGTGRCESGSCVGGTMPGATGGAPGEGGAGPGSSSGGEAGNAATSSGGNGETGAPDLSKQGGAFVREPGGCACSTPKPSAPSNAAASLLLASLALTYARRRRRSSSSPSGCVQSR